MTEDVTTPSGTGTSRSGTTPTVIHEGLPTQLPDIDPDEFLSGLEEHRKGPDALALLSWAARHGGAAPVEAKPGRALVELPKGLVPIWKEHDVPVAERRRQRGLAYLDTRGVSRSLAEFYQIHVGVVGRYESRVAVPVLTAESREVAGWVARATRAGLEPKVLNTPSNDTVSIDDHLFSLDKAQGVYTDVVLVEGVFDAMKHGPNFLALLGKALKKRQLIALLRAKFQRVTVMLDRDAHGPCRELARALRMHIPEVRYAMLRSAKDPGDATREQVQEALATALPA